MIDDFDEYNKKMNSYKTDKKKISTINKKIVYEEPFFYKIKDKRFLICDINCCKKSERTFDITVKEFAENNALQKTLDICNSDNIQDFSDCLAYIGFNKVDEKRQKLLKNPTLRILVEDPELLIDVLEILKPDDIRVYMRKYNV